MTLATLIRQGLADMAIDPWVHGSPPLTMDLVPQLFMGPTVATGGLPQSL